MNDELFAVRRWRHRALGPLLRLTLADQLRLDLTPQEASTLSLALIAVRAGLSPEKEIYMSPIASDGHFSGHVGAAGMRIAAGEGELHLEWPQVERLATALAAGLSD